MGAGAFLAAASDNAAASTTTTTTTMTTTTTTTTTDDNDYYSYWPPPPPSGTNYIYLNGQYKMWGRRHWQTVRNMTTKCFPRRMLSRRPALRALPGPWLQKMPMWTHWHQRLRGTVKNAGQNGGPMDPRWLASRKSQENFMILFSWSSLRKAVSSGEVGWLRLIYTQLSRTPSPPPPQTAPAATTIVFYIRISRIRRPFLSGL